MDRDAIIDEFKDVVNMTPATLKKFLKTDDSTSVGWTHGKSTESVGHKSGRRIITLLEKEKGEYTADDIKHMQKVIGYVHRHMKQRPEGDVKDTRWRYSLMNWGHDPLKKRGH